MHGCASELCVFLHVAWLDIAVKLAVGLADHPITHG